MARAMRAELRHRGRAAMALSLAALLPGLGHLTLGRWVKGAVLFGMNLGALVFASHQLVTLAGDVATLGVDQAAESISPIAALYLALIALGLIGIIVYSVQDVRRLLRDL